MAGDEAPAGAKAPAAAATIAPTATWPDFSDVNLWPDSTDDNLGPDSTGAQGGAHFPSISHHFPIFPKVFSYSPYFP